MKPYVSLRSAIFFSVLLSSFSVMAGQDKKGKGELDENNNASSARQSIATAVKCFVLKNIIKDCSEKRPELAEFIEFATSLETLKCKHFLETRESPKATLERTLRDHFQEKINQVNSTKINSVECIEKIKLLAKRPNTQAKIFELTLLNWKREELGLNISLKELRDLTIRYRDQSKTHLRTLDPLFSLYRDHFFKLFPHSTLVTDKELLEKWLKETFQSKQAFLFLCVCPDYAIDGAGHYTFNGLNKGTESPVITRGLTALSQLIQLFHAHKVKMDAELTFADFEAFDFSTLQRVGLNYGDFLEHLSGSREKAQEKINSITREVASPEKADIAIRVEHFTSLYGGREEFQETTAQYCENLSLSPEKMSKIKAARKNILERWYGTLDDATLTKILNTQGAQLATMGSLVAQKNPKRVVFAVDNSIMKPFWEVNEGLTVVYLKGAHY